MAEIVAAPNAGPIRMPEWDDVLHIRPRAEITKATRQRWNEYMTANDLRAVPAAQLKDSLADKIAAGEDVAGLDRNELETLMRGRQIYQDMQASQIPGWRREMIKVLTTLDNIEDQVSTIEWVTRPVTRLWKPTAWASKVTRRTNEVISNVESVIAGPTIAKFRAKQRAERTNKRTARAATGKAGKLAQVASWLNNNKGHLLEAGQAVDTWAGVGISLGSIFGAVEEAQDRLIISAWEGAKFAVAEAAQTVTPFNSELYEILQQQKDESIGKIERSGAPLVEQWWNYVKKHPTPMSMYLDLVITVTGAQRVQTKNDTYTRAEHALALYHSATITPLLAETLARITDPRVLDRIGQLEAPRPRVRDSHTRDLLEEAGATLTRAGDPTGEWQEPARSLHRAIEADLDETLAAMQTWLPRDADTDDAALLHALTEAAAGATSTVLTGTAEGIHITPDAATRAELLMYHLDALPPAGTSRETLTAWLADQVQAINAAPTTYDWRTWRDVTARHWPVPHLQRPQSQAGERFA